MASDKKISLILLLAIYSCLFITGCGKENHVDKLKTDTTFNRSMENIEKENYEKVINYFSPITVEELKEGISINTGEKTYVYVGQSTCPDCRNFILKLGNNIPSNYKIYSIDTDKCSEQEINELSEIDLTEIPSIIQIGQGKNIKLMTINEFESEIKQ